MVMPLRRFLFKQSRKFMPRQTDSDVFVEPLGGGDEVHDALQFGIAGWAVDQAVDLDGDKITRHAILVAVVAGDFRHGAPLESRVAIMSSTIDKPEPFQ